MNTKFTPTWGIAEGLDTESVAGGEPEIVMAVEGKIISIFDAETRTGKYGEYTIQNCKFETNSGEIAATLFNFSLDASDKGKRFSVRCGKSKNGLKGIRYEIQSWKDKKTGDDKHKEVLVLDDNCAFVFADQSGALHAHKPAPKPAQKPLPAADAGWDKPTVSKTTPELFAREDIGFNDAVKNLVAKHMVVHEVVSSVYSECDAETRRAYTSTIWIALDRIGFINARPPEEVKPQRKAWEETVIPSGSNAGKKLGDIDDETLIKIVQYGVENSKEGEFWDRVREADDDKGFTERGDVVPF